MILNKGNFFKLKKKEKENIGRTFTDKNCRNIFLDSPPKAKKTKANINKWDLIKLKSF